MVNKSTDDEMMPSQISHGEHARTAGRDYFEVMVVQSARAVLETAPEETVNKISVNNPRFFRFRFGWNWPKLYRKALVRFSQEHEFTDGQIKGLYRSGNLKCTPTGISVLGSRTKFWVGLMIAIYINAIYALPISLNWQRIQSDALLAIRTVEVVSVSIVFTWSTYKVFIEPWLLMTRRKVSNKEGYSDFRVENRVSVEC